MEDGTLRVVGIVQEQHPDRARLFMQWKEMRWPILVDSLDQLGVSVVPITLLVDRDGVIQARNPRPGALASLLEGKGNEQEPTASAPPHVPDLSNLEAAARKGGAGDWRSFANALFLWGDPERIDEAVDAYRRSVELEPNHAPAWFRLGVTLRRRFESPRREGDDFQSAVEAWGRALELEPNQYIWRRRIQQYGPRLEKPYPFYDWVVVAREEIEARGETPVPLPIDPKGAELAKPARGFQAFEGKRTNPDPEDRITHDDGRFVQVEAAVVPAAIAPGSTARIHVFLRPNLVNRAHWNNEARDLVVWVEASEGVEIDDPLLTVPNPPREVSQETRAVEFEIKIPGGARGSLQLPAYALYYVCEDEDGTCLFRRQDIPLEINVR